MILVSHLGGLDMAADLIDAAIRANLTNDPYAYPAQTADPYAQQPATYSQQPATYALPNPPHYGGYR